MLDVVCAHVQHEVNMRMEQRNAANHREALWLRGRCADDRDRPTSQEARSHLGSRDPGKVHGTTLTSYPTIFGSPRCF